MENKSLPAWLIQVLGILLIIFIALLIFNQVKILATPSQTLRVSAVGTVTAIPDVATVTIGVVSQGTTPVEVMNSNNKKINQIITFIKAQGIADNNIKTTAFYASPKYNYTNGQNVLAGYQADQSVTVKITSIDKSRAQLEKIIAGAIDNGANQIQNVSFSFIDTDKLKQSAIKQAIQKAKEKAQQLTSESNIKLGNIINIIEAPDEFSNPMARNVSFAANTQSVRPNIEPGDQEISGTISLIFAVN